MPVLRLLDAAIAPASTSTSLLDHVDLTISPRARCAIIGPNGSGKSTLLAALAAHQPLLSGRRDCARDTTLAFADRGPRTPGHSVEAEMLTHRPTDAAALADLRGATDPLDLVAAIDAWSERGGWQLEADMARALSGIGLANIAPDRLLAELSGGQRQRVELAALLLSSTDIILLDEPTDDLDDVAVSWFERELLTLDRAVVIASHDRALLDHWPVQIVMIDAHAKRIVTGAGPLAHFEEHHARLADAADRDYVAIQRRAVAAERAAAARAAQAMTMNRVALGDGKHTKNQKAYYNERAGGLARSSRVLRERDARNHVDKPWRDKSVGRVTVASSAGVQRSTGGGVLARISNLRAGYNGIPVTDAVDLAIERGERIVITGPNGAGKTTLLRTLTGELAPISGHIKLGPTRIAVLEQRIPADLLTRTAIEVIDLRVEPDQRAAARLMLGTLLVRGRDLQRPVIELSEGSRRKVLLAALLASGADLLLLDEPANHLDLQSRDALARALEASPAAILMTSHDRALREQIATRMIEVGAGSEFRRV